jgi:hypothetical protein
VDAKFVNLSELEARGWKEAEVRPVARKPTVAPRKHLPAATKKPAGTGTSGTAIFYYNLRDSLTKLIGFADSTA